jgi:adenylate cyclase
MDECGSPDTFLFEQFRLDRRGGGLVRLTGDGQSLPVSISSRAVDVLAILIERHGDLVSKDDIMNAVWPETVVEEANLTVQVSALRRVLDRDRAKGSCIQTIPGRGYRFIVPVLRRQEAPPVLQVLPIDSPPIDSIVGGAAPHAEASGGPMLMDISAAASARATVGAGRSAQHEGGLRLAILLSGLSLAIGALLFFGPGHNGWLGGPTDRPRLSLVVLPFENLGGDPKENYLADGITDDLTTDLSRVPGMFVIARTTAFTYQGKAVDVRKLGVELGVRYVLEGSVRKAGDELRVNVQLVATETGAHLWADRFDEHVKDLSDGQEEIVRRLGQTLNVALWDVESASSRRERPNNPDAFDLILRARSIGLHTMGPREHAERLTLYEQALRLDPSAIGAMIGLANELILRTFNEYAATGDELVRAARLLADAAAINPNHPFVMGNAAFLLFAEGRYTEAAAADQRTLKYYPNADFAYSQIAVCMIMTGRADEAIPMIEMAMRLDPRSPHNWSRYGNMSWALVLLGKDQEAIVWTQRALEANPDNAPTALAMYNIRLAASYARLGLPDEAHRALTEANRVWPYDTVRMHWPAVPSNRVQAAQVERFQEALRLAGHRDHAEETADFGVVSDGDLHHSLPGPTPMIAPGATTIRTAELERLLAERKPIVLDPLLYSWGRSIPGAIGLKNVGKNMGMSGSLSDVMQDRLRRKMYELTSGDLNRPIVAAGWNSERFDGRNLALRLAALGYTQVYWYRGGREAWEVNGLPETAVDIQDW